MLRARAENRAAIDAALLGSGGGGGGGCGEGVAHTPAAEATAAVARGPGFIGERVMDKRWHVRSLPPVFAGGAAPIPGGGRRDALPDAEEDAEAWRILERRCFDDRPLRDDGEPLVLAEFLWCLWSLAKVT